MDRQNRVGSKPGAGGIASSQAQARARKQRLAELAMESFDLSKDPYFMQNSIGRYECKLCLTQHKTESNYLAHTQGMRHQKNIRKRQMQNAEQANNSEAKLAAQRAAKKIKIPRIGQPGYRISKGTDPNTGQRYFYFEIDYPMIDEKIQPRHRFMSAYEQKIDLPPDPNFQYLLFAALPYETIGFKIPNLPIDTHREKFVSNWNHEKKIMSLKVPFVKEA